MHTSWHRPRGAAHSRRRGGHPRGGPLRRLAALSQPPSAPYPRCWQLRLCEARCRSKYHGEREYMASMPHMRAAPTTRRPYRPIALHVPRVMRNPRASDDRPPGWCHVARSTPCNHSVLTLVLTTVPTLPCPPPLLTARGHAGGLRSQAGEEGAAEHERRPLAQVRVISIHSFRGSLSKYMEGGPGKGGMLGLAPCGLPAVKPRR